MRILPTGYQKRIKSWVFSRAGVFVWSLAALVPMTSHSQALTTSLDKNAFAQHARSLYYRPVEQGLINFTCRVNVDWDTVPTQILLPAEMAGRKPLEETQFFVTVNAVGALSARHEYKQDAPNWMRPAYDKVFGLLTSLVVGTLQTWGTKYLRGPLPEERFVSSVEKRGDGFVMTGHNTPADFTWKFSSDYKLNQMVTNAPGDEIDEHTGFSNSPQGLIITSNDVTNKEGHDTTHVWYEMAYQMVNSFRVPRALHLKVNDNIDTKFAFDNCSVQKGIVLHVLAPPEITTQPPM